MQPCQGDAVFLCESTLFGLLKVDAFKSLKVDCTLVLKAEACYYGKGRYISDVCLWCSANHNAQGQLTNQSRLHLLEGGTL